MEVFYYVEVNGRKVNVPRATKGCKFEDKPKALSEEPSGRIEYDPMVFKDPAKMDGEEFERWLDRASAQTLEKFCSINDGRFL